MNWKQEAIEKLREYEPKRSSMKNIPMEIRRLELDMERIRSASSDGSPLRGGGSGREDMYLSNIVKRQELERALKQTEIWVSAVESALSILDKEERAILDKFFIHPERQAADRLAEDLQVDVKTVYRRKDAALRKFTICLYGGIEN